MCVPGYRAPLESPLRAAEVAAVKAKVPRTLIEGAKASTALTRANLSSMLVAMTEVSCNTFYIF